MDKLMDDMNRYSETSIWFLFYPPEMLTAISIVFLLCLFLVHMFIKDDTPTRPTTRTPVA